MKGHKGVEKKIAILSSSASNARAAKTELEKLYATVPAEEAEIIVALGGDGFMLHTLHKFMNKDVPIYGMNKGTVGFLMNEFQTEDLHERLEKAVKSSIHPLMMIATDSEGEKHQATAINEVSMLRQSYQAASISISIDGKERLDPLVCDGVLVATPAGSTAYNLSAHGPILPLAAPLLAITPVSPFRPRRWRGALLPNSVEVVLRVNDPDKRPVNAVADHTEIKSVIEVIVKQDNKRKATILFDPEHSWDERILAEQFMH